TTPRSSPDETPGSALFDFVVAHSRANRHCQCRSRRLLTVGKVMTRSQPAPRLSPPRRGVSEGVTEPSLTHRVSGGRGLQIRRVSEGMRRGCDGTLANVS